MSNPVPVSVPNKKYQAARGESVIAMVPFGVKFGCEHCGEGKMNFDPNVQPQMIPSADPQQPPAMLFTHVCDSCGKTMLLPKRYPFIQWEEGEDITEQFLPKGGVEE